MLECYPRGVSVSDIPGCGASHSSSRTHSPAGAHSPARAPSVRLTYPIGTIIVPHKHLDLQLRFQRYSFGTDKPLRLRIEDNYVRLPTDEQTVLSTLDDDVIAIFEENTKILRGLYGMGQQRVKFNMISRKTTPVKKTDVNKIPGLGRPFQAFNFIIFPPRKQDPPQQ